MRLFVPILLLILLASNVLLAKHSLLYKGALALQIGFYLLAALGGSRIIPILTRIAAPASAFCMLNAAVVVGFYKFLFTRGPLWKIWTSGAPASFAADGQESADWNATMLNLHLHDQLPTRGVTR